MENIEPKSKSDLDTDLQFSSTHIDFQDRRAVDMIGNVEYCIVTDTQTVQAQGVVYLYIAIYIQMYEFTATGTYFILFKINNAHAFELTHFIGCDDAKWE